uniref:MFS domain-containing protein n=1 Tax=Syphacia muris TaxID=451379 RepID=A0A0N5APT1_9BILA
MKKTQFSAVGSEKAVVVLIVTMILDLLAFTCILPLFPSILDFYSKSENKVRLDWLYEKFVSATVRFQEFLLAGFLLSKKKHKVKSLGFLGSTFSGLQFLSFPLLGALSDIYGRKPLMIFSVIWSQASTFKLFLLSRLIGGLSKATVSLSTAIVSDLYLPDTVGKGMALIGIAFSVSFIIGPMLGAYFVHTAEINISNHQLFFTSAANFAIVMSIIELIVIVVFMEESKNDFQKTKLIQIVRNVMLYVQPSNLFGFTVVKNSISKIELQKLRIYGKAYFSYLFLFSGLEFTLSFLTRVRFNYNSMQQGKMFLFIGLIMVLTQGCLIRRLPIARQAKYSCFGIIILFPAFIIIAVSESFWIFHLGLFFYSISPEFVVSCLTSCASNTSSPELKGTTLGVFRSLGALARATGPIVASSGTFWLVGPKMCYILSAILLVIPMIFLSETPEKKITKKE